MFALQLIWASSVAIGGMQLWLSRPVALFCPWVFRELIWTRCPMSFGVCKLQTGGRSRYRSSSQDTLHQFSFFSIKWPMMWKEECCVRISESPETDFFQVIYNRLTWQLVHVCGERWGYDISSEVLGGTGLIWPVSRAEVGGCTASSRQPVPAPSPLQPGLQVPAAAWCCGSSGAHPGLAPPSRAVSCSHLLCPGWDKAAWLEENLSEMH